MHLRLGEHLIAAIERRRDRMRKLQAGPIGDFFRNGGVDLLYELPVVTNDLVIDAGGFQGEWSSKMIVRYGCRCDIFEPVPTHCAQIKNLFQHNAMVRVFGAALGGASRVTNFRLAANSSSEFFSKDDCDTVMAEVIDIQQYLDCLGDAEIACLKLNIEGGEYEVLERLIEKKHMGRFKSLLIQYHSKIEGWEDRRNRINASLHLTHNCSWSYPMVWEKWVRS